MGMGISKTSVCEAGSLTGVTASRIYINIIITKYIIIIKH